MNLNKTGAALTIGTIISTLSLAACGSSTPTALRPVPTVTVTQTTAPANEQTADSVLTTDGYTPAINLSTSEINCSFGDSAQYVTSGAAGFSSSGDGNVEMVIVLTPVGMTVVNPDGNLAEDIDTAIPGSTATASGDALIVDMPAAVFSNLTSTPSAC